MYGQYLNLLKKIFVEILSQVFKMFTRTWSCLRGLPGSSSTHAYFSLVVSLVLPHDDHAWVKLNGYKDFRSC